jgi:hypothetical protein
MVNEKHIRYSPSIDGLMFESENGDWVKFRDYEEVLTKLEDANEMLTRCPHCKRNGTNSDCQCWNDE